MQLTEKSKSLKIGTGQLNSFFMSKLFILVLLITSTVSADVNVLIVGTTADNGDRRGTGSKAFDVRKVKAELENILAGANLGAVNVQVHDYSANGISGNSLLGEFYLSLGAGTYPWGERYDHTPTATEFRAMLRGESGTGWDYVILLGESFTIEELPGVYSLGVAECNKEIKKGGAETVLLMPWPAQSSQKSVNHYKEVVYRTGRSLGLKVAPAGLAWEKESSVYGTTHPTNDGAYIAAASLFSRIWSKSAKESSYNYNDTLADSVHQEVTANIGKKQYEGRFQNPSKVFDMH